MVAQSPRPMDLSSAYSALSRRRHYGRTKVTKSKDIQSVESPRIIRLPYSDN